MTIYFFYLLFNLYYHGIPSRWKKATEYSLQEMNIAANILYNKTASRGTVSTCEQEEKRDSFGSW